MKRLIFGIIVLVSLSFTLQSGTQLDQAKIKAAIQNKAILLVFTGSDWNKNSKKINENILLSDGFRSYANDNLEIVIIDFPKLNKNKLSEAQSFHNKIVAEKYNATMQIPYLLLLDEKGKVISVYNTNKATDASTFINQIKHSIDGAKQ